MYDEDTSFSNSRSNWANRVAGLLAMLGAAFLVKIGFQALTGPSTVTPERLASEIESDPMGGETYRAIKAAFPQEYRAFLNRAASIANEQGIPAAQREAFQFSRALMRDNIDQMLSAPSARLQQIAVSYADVMQQLQSFDVALCGRFVTSGFTPSVQPPRQVLESLGHTIRLQIGAIQAGRTSDRPARRDISASDAQQFMDRLGARDSVAARLISDQSAIQSAPASQQCSTGIAVYETAAELPIETSANVIAVLLRESFQPPGI